MKIVLFWLLGLGAALAGPVHYTAKLEFASTVPDGLRLNFALREKGDTLGDLLLSVSKKDPRYELFTKDIARDATDEIFYDLTLPEPLQGISVSLEKPGAPKEETLSDVVAPALGAVFLRDGADLLDVRHITENEFLGVKPGKVAP